MEFIKTIIKNKKLVWQLGKNDFKNKFASTSLGSVWGFLQPFVFMAMYVIVFQYIFKSPGPAEDVPYVVWFLPGMAMWQTINDMIISSSNSIRTYSYLVKKVVFPIDVIPVISIVSCSFVALFLIIVATIVCAIFGFIPNILQMLYIIISMYVFIIAFTRFTSAVTTLVPDFSQLLNILMQLFFWFTPVVWNLSYLAGHNTILKIMKCMPFTYLITGFRDSFMSGNIITEDNFLYTIAFWIITIVMIIWSNYIFKKSKKDFADVL